jgi:hypothetical protein
LKGNSLSMRLLFVFLFLSFFQISAQTEKKSLIGATFQYQSMDFFLTGNYFRQLQKFEYTAGFGVGINRTLFQKRFFPIIGISGSYYFLNRSKFQLGPTILFQSSLLKVNSQTTYFNYYNQLSGGYTLAFGKRLEVYQSTFYGINFESYYSTLLDKYNTINSLKFSLQVGVKYAL